RDESEEEHLLLQLVRLLPELGQERSGRRPSGPFASPDRGSLLWDRLPHLIRKVSAPVASKSSSNLSAASFDSVESSPSVLGRSPWVGRPRWVLVLAERANCARLASESSSKVRGIRPISSFTFFQSTWSRASTLLLMAS